MNVVHLYRSTRPREAPAIFSRQNRSISGRVWSSSSNESEKNMQSSLVGGANP